MTSRERVRCSLSHGSPDSVAVDFGSTPVTGMHVQCVEALRQHYGLEKRPVKVSEPYEMLGEMEDDLLDALGVDAIALPGPGTMFGFRNENWKLFKTPWKTFKHSCGAVEPLIEGFIDSGFDILNPVQCSAAGMDPRTLVDKYGDRIVFWGGGVDTQKTLPFGTPEQVRLEVLERCEIFSRRGGFVFNAIHNILPNTPVDNIVAMIDAVREFNGICQGVR